MGMDLKRKCDCLMDGCSRPRYGRGLCEPHYRQYYRLLVGRGRKPPRPEIEAELIEAGLLLPIEPRKGRKPPKKSSTPPAPLWRLKIKYPLGYFFQDDETK